MSTFLQEVNHQHTLTIQELDDTALPFDSTRLDIFLGQNISIVCFEAWIHDLTGECKCLKGVWSVKQSRSILEMRIQFLLLQTLFSAQNVTKGPTLKLWISFDLDQRVLN